MNWKLPQAIKRTWTFVASIFQVAFLLLLKAPSNWEFDSNKLRKECRFTSNSVLRPTRMLANYVPDSEEGQRQHFDRTRFSLEDDTILFGAIPTEPEDARDDMMELQETLQISTSWLRYDANARRIEMPLSVQRTCSTSFSSCPNGRSASNA